MAAINNSLILIPTYNERGNLANLLSQLQTLTASTDILFIDDNSPDGTGRVLDEITRNNKQIFVIHRPEKLGIGSAHKQGIEWAYKKHYQTLVTMDCDGSHSPNDISRFIKASANSDIVVGSRFLLKDSLSEWNYHRAILTRFGHYLTCKLLNMEYDATGAFRLYKLSTIPKELFDLITSNGYSFFFESLYVFNANRCKIIEISISLPARTYGHSKMKLRDIIQGGSRLCSLFLSSFFHPNKYQTKKSLALATDVSLTDNRDWDNYWTTNKPNSRLLYDLIATFYRRFIIKRNLDYFVNKYFPSGSKVLHAGCGSGQVDTSVCKKVDLTALDISVKALALYRQNNNDKARLIHGDISNTPITDQQFSGIYNLGVMEHFNEPEIQIILAEFRRILSDDGKLLLFWPPEFGISVIFFKVLVIVFEKILRRSDVRFHPTEFTRLRSKDHARRLMDQANMSIIEYSFSMRDLFTHVVIVAEKRF